MFDFVLGNLETFRETKDLILLKIYVTDRVTYQIWWPEIR